MKSQPNHQLCTRSHPFRKPFSLLLLLACWLGFVQKNWAQSQVSINIKIAPQGYFDVVEHYRLNLGQLDEKKKTYDLYRSFPTETPIVENNKIKRQTVYISEVAGVGSGFEYWSSKMRQKNEAASFTFKNDGKDGWLGVREFELRYRVKNAMRRQNDSVYFFWPIFSSTSFQGLKIEKLNFTIQFPAGYQAKPKDITLFKYGVNADSGFFPITVPIGTSTTAFVGQLSPEDGVPMNYWNDAIKIQMPKNIINRTYYPPPIWPSGYWLPITLMGLLACVYLRIRYEIKNYDPAKVQAVTSYYPPAGIDPLMAGLLIDDQLDFRDLTSLVAKWQDEGVVKLSGLSDKNSQKNSLKIIRIKEQPANPAAYEKQFFDYLFPNPQTQEFPLSSFKKNDWLKDYKIATQNLLKTADKFYNMKAWDSLANYAILVFSIGAVWLAIAFFFSLEINSWLGFGASIVILFLCLFILMPSTKKKTPIGKEILAELKGFRKFIALADAPRIKKLMAEDPAYFEKTTPYAAAFGLLKEWSDLFK